MPPCHFCRGDGTHNVSCPRAIFALALESWDRGLKQGWSEDRMQTFMPVIDLTKTFELGYQQGSRMKNGEGLLD